MQATRSTVTSMVVAGALAATLAVPAWGAGGGSGATSHGSVSYSVPDVQFDGPDCVEVPAAFTFQKTAADPTDVSLTATLKMAQAGSNSSIDTSEYFGYFAGAAGSGTSDLYVCPYSYEPSAGPFTVTGSMESEFDLSAKQTAPLTPVTVNVIQNPVKLGALRFSKSSSFYTLKGTAIANAPSKGAIGAGGTIVVSVRKPGSKRWVKGTTTSPDSFGAWEAYLSDSVRKGWWVKVDLLDCRWCANATTSAKVNR